MKYNPIIGLEIHAELRTKSKMFCSCKNDPNERRPNVNVCPICMGHPGTLPVANEEAIKKVIKTGLALNCQIPEKSKFDRKNYFYPDLPKGYQISQYDMPLSERGYLKIRDKKIRITRIHLEEDTGRLVHPIRDSRGSEKTQNKDISNEVRPEDKNYSLVDFNRAGIPLMEMVTEPDLESGKEARAFAEEFQLILRYLGVSDADMEKGQFRVEVNISLMQNQKMGTKVEIKNLNSFRAVEKAIDYEIKRQGEVLSKREKVVQETRGWDGIRELTFSQRKKEEAHDYRYLPEPDLPTLHLAKDFVEKIKAEIPELPQTKRIRLAYEYKLDEKAIKIFASNKNLGEYFEKVMSELRNWVHPVKSAESGAAKPQFNGVHPVKSAESGAAKPQFNGVKETETKKAIDEKEFLKLIKLATNYIISDLQGLLKGYLITNKKILITPENFAEFITLIYEGKISSKIAKTILGEMFKTGADPSHIIEDKELSQVTDTGEIEKIIKEIISKNPKPVEDYKKGKENALQFLVGQVMAVTRGRAKPDIVQKLLKEFLQE